MADIAKSVLDAYPDYETNIGIEVHVQFTTKSKVFCSCSNEITVEPNKNICEICTGHPGCLPVLNKQVVDYAILAGLATNCTITRHCGFARKHYFYPDLPKKYQIPRVIILFAEWLYKIRLEDGSKKKFVLFEFIWKKMQEKVFMHRSNESFIDFNRAGTPLLEIVSYPDIASAYEAQEYLKNITLNCYNI